MGSEAGSYIPDGWCKSKKIDSVGLQAQKWMTLHEKDPTKAFCTRALKAYDATLSAIGYGLLVKSDLVKSDLMNNRRQCLEDLELVSSIFSCITNIFFLLQTENQFVL